ncbi:MAG: hypothetical protein WCK96_09700 [Methylococcales bacterium]
MSKLILALMFSILFISTSFAKQSEQDISKYGSLLKKENDSLKEQVINLQEINKEIDLLKEQISRLKKANEENDNIQRINEGIYSKTISSLSAINTIAVVGSLLLVVITIITGLFGNYLYKKIIDVEDKSKKSDEYINDFKLLKERYEEQRKRHDEEHSNKIQELERQINESKKEIDDHSSKLYFEIKRISKLNHNLMLIDDQINAGEFDSALGTINKILENTELENDILNWLKIDEGIIYCSDKMLDIDKALQIFSEVEDSAADGDKIILANFIGYCYLVKCNDKNEDISTSYVNKAIERFTYIIDNAKSKFDRKRAKLNKAECHLLINEFENAYRLCIEIETDDCGITDLDVQFIKTVKLICFNEMKALDKNDELYQAFQNIEFISNIKYAKEKYIFINVLIEKLEKSYHEFKTKTE